MKRSIGTWNWGLVVLALSIALHLPGSVRADEKTRFTESLAMPLSRAETIQLESLLRAE